MTTAEASEAPTALATTTMAWAAPPALEPIGTQTKVAGTVRPRRTLARRSGTYSQAAAEARPATMGATAHQRPPPTAEEEGEEEEETTTSNSSRGQRAWPAQRGASSVAAHDRGR